MNIQVPTKDLSTNWRENKKTWRNTFVVKDWKALGWFPVSVYFLGFASLRSILKITWTEFLNTAFKSLFSC